MIINAFTRARGANPIYFGNNGKLDTKDSANTSERGKIDWSAKTNVYAYHSIKNILPDNFYKARGEDLEILNDKSYRAPSRRAKWFNPKDCKVYYLIKKSQDDDGKIILRVLDQDGEFIKETRILPKTIVIADKFTNNAKAPSIGNFTTRQIPNISHGQMVSRFAFVTNPFARYVFVDIGQDENPYHAMQKVVKEADVKNVDIVNFSWADLIPVEFYEDFKGKNSSQFPKIAYKIITEEFGGEEEAKEMFCNIEDNAKIIEDINNLTKSGIKVFISAGNSGEGEFNLALLANGVQGVGALNEQGGFSEFNSSRIKMLTPHFERGEYKIKRTKDGINYTGGDYTDYYCNVDKIFYLSGHKLQRHLIKSEDFNKLIKYKKDSSSEFRNYYAYLIGKNTVISGRQACRLFNDAKNRAYDNIVVSLGDWIPYELNLQNELVPHFERIRGTSYSTPIRAARYALNESMNGAL